jgi:hypothetical protein
MTVRSVLLRSYPRQWRDDYGEELAGILAARRLTFVVVADVLGGALTQHFHRDAPWKICGAGLALWFLMFRLVVVLLLHSRTAMLWYWSGGFLIVLAAGAWTVTRRKTGILRGTVASGKAAVAGQAGGLILFIQAVQRTGMRPYLGHPIYEWFVYSVALDVAISVAFGFIGASLAWGICRIRSLTLQSH